MAEIIMGWLSSDFSDFLGSYAQPVAAALAVALGSCGVAFCFGLLSRLVGALFDK